MPSSTAGGASAKGCADSRPKYPSTSWLWRLSIGTYMWRNGTFTKNIYEETYIASYYRHLDSGAGHQRVPQCSFAGWRLLLPRLLAVLEEDDESSCYLLVQRLALWFLRDLLCRYSGVLLESVSRRGTAQRSRGSQPESSKPECPGYKPFWGSVLGEDSRIYRACFHHLLDTVRSDGHHGQDKPTSFTSSGEIFYGTYLKKNLDESEVFRVSLINLKKYALLVSDKKR